MKIFNKSGKHLVLVLLTLILIFVLAFFSTQYYIQKKVNDYLLSEIPKHVDLKYDDVAFSLLNNYLTLTNVSAKYVVPDSSTAKIYINNLEVSGFNFWQFLMNKKINLTSIVLDKPVLNYSQEEALVKNNPKKENPKSIKKPIFIQEIIVKDGSLLFLKKEDDSIQLNVNNFDFTLESMELDSVSLKNNIPFNYQDFKLNSLDIYVNLGSYESMTIDSLYMTDNALKIHYLNINSKYSKSELSTILEKERDHVNLSIDEIFFDDTDFGLADKRFYFNAGSTKIYSPSASIYRDKLVDDDLTPKALYGEMLRELPIAISITEIEIANGQLSYEELVNLDAAAGLLLFNEIEAKIQNLSNKSIDDNNTTIESKALFMQDSRMTLNWSFDVNNSNNIFSASGTFENFDTRSINTYLESNVGLRAKGYVNQIFFTISGNGLNSKGDMKMKYENFEFFILKKNRLGVNKFLSAIGNIFIKKDSKTDEQGYRYGKIEVERDSTKSFFNYLWLNVRSGIGNTLTGNGKKE